MIALLAAAFAAATPVVDCSMRAEPSPPEPAAPAWVVAGPVAWASGGGASVRRGAVMRKAGVSVDAGPAVSVRVLTKRAALVYRRQTRLARRWQDGDRALRFRPCDPGTPMFSEDDAMVGPRTGFPGLLIADRRACVRIRVSRGGSRWIARVPVGRRCR